MDKIIPKLYKEYGEYINSFRAFPLGIDGLKPVERRVLLTAYLVAKEKFVKSARIDGTCIARFHPHGGVYGTIVQLVNQGFLIGQGNFGCKFGVEPVGAAASRYTEAKMSKKTLDLAFKYINYVDWSLNDLGDKEPAALPTMFPLCLLGQDYTQGIGFGYRTLIPSYTIQDLYKRLLWLLGIRKYKPIIKPITDCEITSSPTELDSLLTTGKASIDIYGKIILDRKSSTVTLKSWPPGRRFESILNKVSKFLNNSDIGFTDISVNDTNIVFQVLKQRNTDKIFKSFVKNLKEAVSGKISFETIVVDKNQKVQIKSIDSLLLDTYKAFEEVNKIKLTKDNLKLKSLIDEYSLLEKIRPDLSKELSIKAIDINKTIERIAKKNGVTERVVKNLFSKYTINKLLTIRVDINSLKKNISENNKLLKDLRPFVIKQYNHWG